jgi:hypothetical protein
LIIGIVAFLALEALGFALIFSQAPPNQLAPLGVTFATLTLASCAWLWFRLARRSRVALATFAGMYAVAAATFTSIWTASAMAGTGLALAAPCVLTVAGLIFVAVRLREPERRPRRQR